MKKTSHPDWALAHKRKGTELRLISGKYYLYEVTSKWSPEKKRPVKITGKLLGKITEKEGFVESEKARLRKQQREDSEVLPHVHAKRAGSRRMDVYQPNSSEMVLHHPESTQKT
jgi:hypothetical protein